MAAGTVTGLFRESEMLLNLITEENIEHCQARIFLSKRQMWVPDIEEIIYCGVDLVIHGTLTVPPSKGSYDEPPTRAEYFIEEIFVKGSVQNIYDLLDSDTVDKLQAQIEEDYETGERE